MLSRRLRWSGACRVSRAALSWLRCTISTSRHVFVDNIVFLRAGEVAAKDPVDRVFTEAIVCETFGIDCDIRPDGLEGRLYCLALGLTKG